MTASRTASALAAMAAVAGCSRGGDGAGSAPTPDAAFVATVILDASKPAPSPLASTPPRPPRAPCRAIAVTGRVTSRGGDDGGLGGKVATGDAVPGWLDLESDAKVTVKEPRTGRELLFLGPATVWPCAGESEAWLTAGSFASARGDGEKPGAEQWIVTPSAVVRYGAALVDVKVAGGATRAVLRGGGASALADGGDSWHPLDPAAPLVARAGTGDGDAGDEQCTTATRGATDLETLLLTPGETRDPGFGDLAKRTTEARILARGICAMKSLRAALRASPGSPVRP